MLKKDPPKMLKIYYVLSTELKKIYEYDLYIRNYCRGNMFLVEEIITVMKVAVSDLRV